MNITLWILQVLLALAFLAHGVLLLAPPPEVAVQLNASLPRWFQLFLGVAEVLAAVGLTLPGLTRILPGLVPAAVRPEGGWAGARNSSPWGHIGQMGLKAHMRQSACGSGSKDSAAAPSSRASSRCSTRPAWSGPGCWLTRVKRPCMTLAG